MTINHQHLSSESFRSDRTGMSALQTIVLIAIASLVLIGVTRVSRNSAVLLNNNFGELQDVIGEFASEDSGLNDLNSRSKETAGALQSPASPAAPPTPVPAAPPTPVPVPVPSSSTSSASGSSGGMPSSAPAKAPSPATKTVPSSAPTPTSSTTPKNTPSTPSGTVTASEVKQAIDAVKQQSTSLGQPPITNSVEVNRIVPANTKTKGKKYRALQKANRAVIAAEKKLAKASSEREKLAARELLAAARRTQARELANMKDFMKKRIKIHPSVKRARSAVRKAIAAKRKLTRSGADSQTIANAEEAVQRAKENEAAIRRELETAVENFDPLVNVPRTRHVVDIDSEKITLTNAVDTPYTNSWDTMQGKAKGHGIEHVRKQLAATGMSDDRQRIFAGIVKSEASRGGFTQYQSWDKGKVTWGFAQFTLGPNGNYNISKILAKVKKENPDVFKQRFQKFGIDIATRRGKAVIQVTRPDGTTLTGAKAADFLRTAPKQAAALIVSGKDPVVQRAQISFANSIISKQLNKRVTISGKDSAGNLSSNVIRLKDIMTSEYGVGIIADRSINAGSPKTYRRAKEALVNYMKKHSLDPNDVSSWAADAEEAVIKRLERDAVSARIRNLKSENLSHEPGSFSG